MSRSERTCAIEEVAAIVSEALGRHGADAALSIHASSEHESADLDFVIRGLEPEPAEVEAWSQEARMPERFAIFRDGLPR